jgi:hypothetical protein
VDGIQPSVPDAATTTTHVPQAHRGIAGGQPAERDIAVERAKGVLMGRYVISEAEAHRLLRRHARNANLRLVDVALAVLASHMLLDRRRP